MTSTTPPEVPPSSERTLSGKGTPAPSDTLKVIASFIIGLGGIFGTLVLIIDFSKNGKQSVLLEAAGMILLCAPFLFVIVNYRIYRRENFRTLVGSFLLITAVVTGAAIVYSSSRTSGPVPQPPSGGAADPLPIKPQPTAPASPQSPPVAQVAFSGPETIQAGQDVSVTGSVAGLAAGDMLWIVSSPEVGGQYYVIGQAVADSGGRWKILDFKVGDDSDKGHYITFFALQGNRSCSDFITTVPQGHDSQIFNPIPKECAILAQRAVPVH